MRDDFQAIKDLVDISDEITRRTGGTLKKTGKTLSLSQCPFCEGHDCFRIYPDTRSWSCFQCGNKAGGSIIDFVAREKSCTEHEALTDLAQAHNYELHEPDPDTDKTGQVCHFSIKDPQKKFAYQLPNEKRLPGAPFFNMKAFKENRLAMVKRLVLVEGENDLLTVFGKGHCPYIAAVIGQISGNQLKCLEEWVISGPPKDVFLCFDNDPAGNKYRDRITEALKRYCYPDKVYQINERLRRDFRKNPGKLYVPDIGFLEMDIEKAGHKSCADAHLPRY